MSQETKIIEFPGNEKREIKDTAFAAKNLVQNMSYEEAIEFFNVLGAEIQKKYGEQGKWS